MLKDNVNDRNNVNKIIRTKVGIGYMGNGKYKSRVDGVKTKQYQVWGSMLSRCYNPRYLNEAKNKKYRNTYTCDEWHNFQTFSKWFDDNYYEIDGEHMELDKDFMGGGKFYSPDNCCFIPHRLNTFLTNKKCTNKTGYIGVTSKSLADGSIRYVSVIQDTITGNGIHIGVFKIAKDASIAYKRERANQAEKMKNLCINKWGISDKRILNGIK